MSNVSNVENLSPQVIRSLAKEIADLCNDPPEGIKIFPNDEDITDIQAHIEGPAGTPYAGGSFRMKLVLGKNFPSEPPKGFFLTRIFHPNVASNGEICVNTLKKDWKAELGIKHILLTIKCLLIVPNPESALNEEAGKLLLEQYEDYSTRAKLYTEIHAKPMKCMEEKEIPSLSKNCLEGPLAKKHAGDKKVIDKKKKEKKKVLKRL
ncbi:ubiquitin-conjugating enzyme E2 S-like isoform X2 [Mytilus galloprovincialis]|uniref:E2 ubiquitin-conjugating enzyme n=1 Tax=Mytilus galloprovincialis TaxID=29158 RepID=A0A8B6GEM3_MYTGA|nr:ubiquitin-conjugating enzyme E2 S [Mytilus galloprovincialis]